MDKIKLIIKEELKKESDNYLIESFNKLSSITNEKLFIEQLTETTVGLLNDGYTLEEINLIAEQAAAQTAGQAGNLFSGLKNPETGKFDLTGLLFGGGKSMFWEQILRWLFKKVLGVSEKTAQNAAIVLADYNPLHILRLFKGYNACVQEIAHTDKGGGGLGALIIELFINNSQFQGGSQTMGKVALRNVAAEAIRDSNLDDKLAEKICGHIWKTSDSQNTAQQPAQTNTQPAAQTTAQTPPAQPVNQPPTPQTQTV